MSFFEKLQAFDAYPLTLVVIGIAVIASAFLPRFLWRRMLSAPIILLLMGYAAFALPLGLTPPDPIRHGFLAEHLTELLVIISLMGAGLKIDRPIGWKSWQGTWRLLGITMVLSIALASLVGWWVVGFAPATALLLGALIAPTDPVLASEVQVGSPQHGSDNPEIDMNEGSGDTEEDEFRFTLTSEAGLNDGLAFPFTHAAIAVALAGLEFDQWLGDWLLIHVLYKITAGIAAGYLLGRLLARLILSIPGKSETAKAMVGPSALAATLIIYGVTEYLGGYGFIAVFIGALTIRGDRREHDYHESLHRFTEMSERLLTSLFLVAFGGAIAGGLLDPLTWPLVGAALLIVLFVRPVAGILGLIGFSAASWRERFAISFFGIRGVGSFYYLAYALNAADFPRSRELYALTGLVVVISIFLHGIAATPVSQTLDETRKTAA